MLQGALRAGGLGAGVVAPPPPAVDAPPPPAVDPPPPPAVDPPPPPAVDPPPPAVGLGAPSQEAQPM